MIVNSNRNFEIHGHRGCRGLYPENTLIAFEKAMDLGLDAIEMDVAITKDHQVVVSHEPFMSRKICLDPNGKKIPKTDDRIHNLYNMTHDQIKPFDCGSKFHKDYPEQIKLRTYKPLLREVIELSKLKKSTIRFNIELKSRPEYDGIYTPFPVDFVKLVISEIKSYRILERSNLQSFDLRILESIKQQAPEIKIALLIDAEETISDKLAKLSFKPDIVSPYYELINDNMVRKFQDQGFMVIPWTVNSKDDLELMIHFKVDGIITDYPNRLIDLLVS